MTAGQWFGIGGLVLIFFAGFFTIWRGSHNRRDNNPDNWPPFSPP